jgi:DNA primase
MEHGGLGFVEAVKELAQGLGMKVPEVRSEAAQRRSEQGVTLYEVLLQAAQHYRARLKDAPQAIAYLKQRGLSGDIARRFGIGYAPEEWQGLAAAFSDYDGKALAEAGLVKSNEDGRRYDVFRNRIMFPIVDGRGNVIGFGGRILGEGEPKYLNSPETPVFEKGRELYGLYQARRAIRDAGRVLVVEGYMDVVALAQSGIEYAVATLGTATTPLHVQKLLRQADEIVYCFDGDAAGRRAAWRALEMSLSQLADGKEVRFLFLPDGEDPDTYVRKNGRSAFEGLLGRSVPLSRFLIDELTGHVDLATAEGRARCVHDAKPLLRQMPAGVIRLQVVRELAEKTRLTVDELMQACELVSQSPTSPSVPARAARTPPTSLARQLLRLLVSNPGFLVQLSPERRALLEAPELASVVELVDALRESGATTPAMVFEATRDSQYAVLYQEAAGEMLSVPSDESSALEDFTGALNQLELLRIRSEYERLTAGGVRGEPERLRIQELARRLAELKGAPAAGVRPQA